MRSLLNWYLRFRLGVNLLFAATLTIAISSRCYAENPPPSLDWDKLNTEALEYFRAYLKFDTTNPPSNTTSAIDYLKKLLDHEGITTETFESKPGMVSRIARIPGP